MVGDGPRLEGYAVVFNSLSAVMRDKKGPFREVIRPGAFTAALAGGPPILALYEHDRQKIVGWNLELGGLVVNQDERGLHFELDLDATDLGSLVAGQARRGELRGCSFDLLATKELWKQDRLGRLRVVLEAGLTEITVVGPTKRPSYGATRDDLRLVSSWSVTQDLMRRRLQLAEVEGGRLRKGRRQ